MSLSRELIKLIRAKPVGGEDLKHAARFVLDATANMIAGIAIDPGQRLLAWARDIGLDGPAREGRDPGRYALLYGALAHALETDDLHRASVVHPGCAVVPALWGLAALFPDRSMDGKRALTAMLQGYEAALRIGRSVGPAHYRIWHNTATCGPFGSAMAAAHLLALSEDQCVSAMGNAGTQAAGLWEFIETGAMSKHLHAGRAAEAGVTAAMLARRGFTGAPEILEGGRGFFAAMCPDANPDLVIASPDAPWCLHETSLKPWPSCRHTHPAIDAALGLRRELNDRGIALDEIEEIRVATYQAARDLCDRVLPESAYAAKFSLQHCVAAALRDGDVWFESFGAEARSSLAGLRRRIGVHHSPEAERHYPALWGNGIELRATGGRTLTVSRDYSKGDPESPLSAEETRAKAAKLLRMAGLAEPDELIEGICAMATGAPPPRLPSLFALSGQLSSANAAE